jgi:hypothetical protein
MEWIITPGATYVLISTGDIAGYAGTASYSSTSGTAFMAQHTHEYIGMPTRDELHLEVDCGPHGCHLTP